MYCGFNTNERFKSSVFHDAKTQGSKPGPENNNSNLV